MMPDPPRVHMLNGHGLLCRPDADADRFARSRIADRVTCRTCLNRMAGRSVCAPAMDAPPQRPPRRSFGGFPSVDYCHVCGLSFAHWVGCTNADG